ncbi:MAG: XRE family transcriptional regulator [Thermomicrobiales bacterium]|nr:XRE family transcriptional regulator [Thermomicrobiales bacterium]
MRDDLEYTVSSGNLYADLGFADPELELAKATLARQIAAIIRARGLTQRQAAEALGLDQPGVSRLVRGRLGVYSAERLMQLLTKLDVDVEINLIAKEPSRAHGRIIVSEPNGPLTSRASTSSQSLGG